MTLKIGDSVQVNNFRSFEYHGLEGVIIDIRIKANGKTVFGVKFAENGIKEFGVRSLIKLQKE